MAGVKGRSGMSPNSRKNLRKDPNEGKTQEEIVEQARKAGIASGQARRRKREMRAIIDDFLSMPMKKDKELDEANAYDEAQRMNLTVADAVLMAQIKKAMKGDTRAAEFIRDTAGQKAPQQIQASIAMDPLAEITKQLAETEEETLKRREEDEEE